MRKTFKLGVVTAVAALALAGCSGDPGTVTPEGTPEATGAATDEATPPPAAGGAITIWTDANREPVIREAAAKFEEETGSTVEVIQKNFDDMRTDFIAQVPTGEGPDITVGAHDWLGAFVAAGVVNTVDLGEIADAFEPVTIDAFTYGGQLYGLPYSSEAVALIQNVDLVGEESPADYADMISRATEAGTERPFVINVNGTTGDAYTTYPFQMSFGAPVFVQDETGSYTSEVGMGGEAGENFASWLSEQAAAGIWSTTVDYDISNELFTSGASPYIVAGPWVIDTYREAGMENLKVSRVPSAGGEPASPFVGVQGFYLSSQSQNSLLATNFLVSYLGSEDIQRALYEADPRIPAMKVLGEEFKSDPIIGGFIDSASVGVPMPSIPEMGQVWDLWNAAQVQIMGGAEPVGTWNTMISDLESAIQ